VFYFCALGGIGILLFMLQQLVSLIISSIYAVGTSLIPSIIAAPLTLLIPSLGLGNLIKTMISFEVLYDGMNWGNMGNVVLRQNSYHLVIGNLASGVIWVLLTIWVWPI